MWWEGQVAFIRLLGRWFQGAGVTWLSVGVRWFFTSVLR